MFVQLAPSLRSELQKEVELQKAPTPHCLVKSRGSSLLQLCSRGTNWQTLSLVQFLLMQSSLTWQLSPGYFCFSEVLVKQAEFTVSFS